MTDGLWTDMTHDTLNATTPPPTPHEPSPEPEPAEHTSENAPDVQVERYEEAIGTNDATHLHSLKQTEFCLPWGLILAASHVASTSDQRVALNGVWIEHDRREKVTPVDQVTITATNSHVIFRYTIDIGDDWFLSPRGTFIPLTAIRALGTSPGKSGTMFRLTWSSLTDNHMMAMVYHRESPENKKVSEYPIDGWGVQPHFQRVIPALDNDREITLPARDSDGWPMPALIANEYWIRFAGVLSKLPDKADMPWTLEAMRLPRVAPTNDSLEPTRLESSDGRLTVAIMPVRG